MPASWSMQLLWQIGGKPTKKWGNMQSIIRKQDANTKEFRRILFIYQGQTIVSVSQTLCHKVDAQPRPAEVNWGAMSSKSFDHIEALGQALLEATAIAREWGKFLEETLYRKSAA
jgi:hypothetical protein